MPPIITKRVGPNLSTSQPSKGTSQVSRSTNTVKVTEIAAAVAFRCFCRAWPTTAQPYWKLATATMLMLLAVRITQRLGTLVPGTATAVDSAIDDLLFCLGQLL